MLVNRNAVRNDSILYLVSPHARPAYYLVAEYLWGANADIDSDGDSRWPGDEEWTELSLILRNSSDSAQVHIDPVSTDPLILQIRSPDAGLTERVANYLSKQTEGVVAHIVPARRS